MLFKKAIMFTDIHFGEKNNSRIHNQDCSDFIDWVIKVAKSRDIDTLIFLGDWHHSRHTINVTTLNYTAENIKKINDNFNKSFIINGNHDLYYREKRDVHSLPLIDMFPNIEIINEPKVIDDVGFVPWLVDEEWRDVINFDCKYMFGHFELPAFKMNAMVEMPDHGGLNRSHFKNQEYVFSGHFHLRQVRDNVHYIGNPFGHNFSDAWDTNRGACILEWGSEPEYLNYENGPKYINVALSDLLTNMDDYLKPKTYIKCNVDCDITYEEACAIRETMLSNYDVREFKLIPQKNQDVALILEDDITYESIDQIVLSSINALDSNTYDKNVLLSIYNNLF